MHGQGTVAAYGAKGSLDLVFLACLRCSTAAVLLVINRLQLHSAWPWTHSEHRFPAPSSLKEGCRKPVLGVWAGLHVYLVSIVYIHIRRRLLRSRNTCAPHFSRRRMFKHEIMFAILGKEKKKDQKWKQIPNEMMS